VMVDEDATRPKAEARPTQTADGGGPSAESGAAGDPPDPGTPTEIDQLRTELAATKDRLLRERAELENYKKRVVRDKADAIRFGCEPLLRDLFPIIDNLRRALDHARTSEDVAPIIEGVTLVLRSLDEALERHGVQIVDACGTSFDPNRHEAIGHVESEQPANTVIAEHQRGYLLHDRLLRPALVTVGKGQTRGNGAAAGDVEKAPDDD